MRWIEQLTPSTSLYTGAQPAPGTAVVIDQIDAAAKALTGTTGMGSHAAMDAVRGPLRVGCWIMLGIFGIGLGWGALAPIDSAAIAHGSIALESNKKTVQHLEGGMVSEILVKEGDRVAQGQKLVVLNDTASASGRDIIQRDLWDARAAVTRLTAERDEAQTLEFDPALQQTADADPELQKMLDTQRNLFASSREAYQARLGMLDQRIEQSKQEIEGLQSQIEGATNQLSLLDEETEALRKLVKKGYAPKPRLLALERQAEELKGNKGQYQASIAKAEQVMAETRLEIANTRNEYANKNAGDLREAQGKVSDLQEKLRAASDVAKRTVITAPVAGIITGLKTHTIGGVIAPGEAIMDIIPQDDMLVVEAKVQPNDIDVVHAGLEAKVMLTAYKARTTPKLKGKVTQVSADKFTDGQGTQATSYYLARVEVDKDELAKLEKPVELTPGMPADVLVKTGERSFLHYLFQPILDSMHKAFREE